MKQIFRGKCKSGWVNVPEERRRGGGSESRRLFYFHARVPRVGVSIFSKDVANGLERGVENDAI